MSQTSSFYKFRPMAFLVFEGIDASGKSTLLNLLCEALKKQGVDFVKTREPGGTALGGKIREILLDKQHPAPNSLAEALLYYADRKQHIEELIKPSLKKGLWVLSDRYWASTSAYQCGGRGIDESFINQLRDKVCMDCEPDLWILLDLPVEETLKRLAVSKNDSRDRFERENKEFHQRVREYYLKLAKKEPSKWFVLSVDKTPEQLLERILSYLEKKAGFSNFLKQNL